jgi:hypothetical protein
MAYMCQNATIPNNFIFPAGFGSEALDINNIFASATLPTGFSLPDKFGQAATDMKWMFRYTILNGDIDWSGTDLTNLTSDKDYMFYNTTWNGHFIYVQNEGSRTFLITNSSISDNTRIQVKNAVSSTLKAEIDDPTDFLGIPGPARNQITKISFQKTIPNCSNPKDVSLDNNNSILACVVNNTEIVIGAAGTIMANDNSSWLFANLTNIAGVAIDLTNLNTSDVTNMSRMFQISILKSTPIWSNNFGVKSSNISYIFAYTTLLTNFSLPANFGSKATNMTGMFRSITLNDDIDWSNTDLSTSTATKTNMFHSVSWNNHFIYTSNENSKTFLITNSDISDNDRIQIKK